MTNVSKLKKTFNLKEFFQPLFYSTDKFSFIDHPFIDHLNLVPSLIT